MMLFSCILSLSCFLVGGETMRFLIDMFFIFLGYLIHTVILDLFIVFQMFLCNIYQNHPYKDYPLQHAPLPLKLGVLIGGNLLVLVLLFSLELLQETVTIFVVELFIASAGFGIGIGAIFVC